MFKIIHFSSIKPPIFSGKSFGACSAKYPLTPRQIPPGAQAQSQQPIELDRQEAMVLHNWFPLQNSAAEKAMILHRHPRPWLQHVVNAQPLPGLLDQELGMKNGMDKSRTGVNFMTQWDPRGGVAFHFQRTGQTLFHLFHFCWILDPPHWSHMLPTHLFGMEFEKKATIRMKCLVF